MINDNLHSTFETFSFVTSSAFGPFGIIFFLKKMPIFQNFQKSL